jgi:uncharacterized membrane protein
VFSFLRKKRRFFTEEDKSRIVDAVRQAELRTSGEIRVFVESHCKYVDAMDRAVEIFHQLEMTKTKERNAVLIYVALKDRQLAILGDEGIHQRVGDEYWNKEVKEMIREFNKENHADGIVNCIRHLGEDLSTYFPYDSGTDKNELPDDIVFGR